MSFVRFFEGLSQDETRDIISAAQQHRYRANTVVVREGEAAENLYLIASGRARFTSHTPDGRKVILLWLPRGEIFGASALLQAPSKYVVSTETVEHTNTLVWRRPIIRDLILRYPRLADNALMMMFDYVFAYRALHISMMYDSAPERVAQVLVQLATGIGEKTSEGILLDLRNEELANEANVTPYTVSRLLGKWQRQDILRKQRGKVLLLSPERLLRMKPTAA